MSKVPAENFMATIAANVDNEKVSDEDFREFIRNTLPIVDYIKYGEQGDDTTPKTESN
jgi:methyl coenzyme M reductase subunit D